MVQRFAANRTNDAFHVSSLPRRPGSAENLFDIHDCNLVAELLSIDPIPISQQIARRRIERKGFQQLLRGPFSRWMSRDIKVDNASSIMRKDDKDEEDFKPNGGDGEEVDSRKLRNVIVEERSPCLRWRFWTSDHVFGNRGLRDLNPQLHQFAVNPRCAPNRVLAAHGSNQIADFSRNLRTSGFSMTHLPSNTNGILGNASR